MQIEEARKIVAHSKAANTVAVTVKTRREHANAQLAGQYGNDAAGDTTFGRHADAIKPFHCVVVHPARAHHAQDALDVFTANGLLASKRIDTAISERRGHRCQ